MRKKYIVRRFDISYLNYKTSNEDEKKFEKILNEEFGRQEYIPCAIIPLMDTDGKLVAYKFIFVKDIEGEDKWWKNYVQKLFLQFVP